MGRLSDRTKDRLAWTSFIGAVICLLVVLALVIIALQIAKTS